MKYTVSVGITEHTWEGSGGEYDEYDNEDPLYDKFNDWMSNGKDGEKVISKIDGYMKRWDENAYGDGGSLYNPNGIDWDAKIEVHPNIIKSINKELEDFCRFMKGTKDFNSCPVELFIYYSIDGDNINYFNRFEI